MTLFVLLTEKASVNSLIRFPYNGSLLYSRSYVLLPPRCFSFPKLKEDTILGGKGLVMSLNPLTRSLLPTWPIRGNSEHKGYLYRIQTSGI